MSISMIIRMSGGDHYSVVGLYDCSGVVCCVSCWTS